MHGTCTLDDAYNQVWVDLFKKTPMAARVEISRERFRSQTALSKLMTSADCGVFLSAPKAGISVCWK